MRRLENDLDQQEDGGDTDALTVSLHGMGPGRRKVELLPLGGLWPILYQKDDAQALNNT